MAFQEREFHEIFPEQPEPSLEVSKKSLNTTLYGAGLMLAESPTVESFRDAIAFFSRKPGEYIEAASDVLMYGEDYEGRQTPLNDPLTLVGDVVSKVRYHFDRETMEVGDELDPQTGAEDIVDRMGVREEERKWAEVHEQFQAETNPHRRLELARQIKEDVMSYMSANPVVFRADSERALLPLWDNIAGSGHARPAIKMRHSEMGIESFGEAAREAKRVIDRADLQDSIDHLPKLDKGRFDELRKQFGAKAANLILAQEVCTTLNSLFILTGEDSDADRIPSLRRLSIPEFTAVPVDLYRKWKSGEDIDTDLQPYFAWTQTLTISGEGYYVDEQDAYMIRSSAVHSEDGEHLTGAGIYESVEVDYEEANKFDAFKKAVAQVFESTDSPRAQSYREENGIPFEEMGLVLQRRKPERYGWRSDDAHKATINSSAAGINELTEVISRDQRYFVNKEIVDENLGRLVPENAMHFRPDRREAYFRNTLTAPELISYTIMAALLGNIWGGSVQIECVGDEIVQIRKVPDVVTAERVEFPNEQELARGNGVGVGDKTLTVLRPKDYNSEEEGLVQYRTNHEWSFRGDPDYLPKDGAVVIQTTGGDNGHIQTLCVERELLCMYPNRQTENTFIQGLREGAQVRIISNGIEARLYQVGEESPFKENEGQDYGYNRYDDDN